MTENAPHISSTMTVENAWIDYNGHLNMAYYNVLFDRAGDEVFELFGLGPDYARQENASTFTLEVHVSYLREIHAGDKVHIHTTMLDFDEKRCHFFQQLYQLDQNFLAATSEQVNMHVDMAKKTSHLFPPHVLEKISSLHKTHQHIPRAPQIGRVMGLRKQHL